MDQAYEFAIQPAHRIAIGALSMALFGMIVRQETPREENLIRDFVDAHLPEKAVQTGDAEFTVHGAAHLRAEAKRPIAAFRIGHEDRFDALGVVEFEEKLITPVARGANRGGPGDASQPCVILEPIAQFPGDVAHLLDFPDALFLNPMEDLLAAKFGESIFRKEIGQLGFRQSAESWRLRFPRFTGRKVIG